MEFRVRLLSPLLKISLPNKMACNCTSKLARNPTGEPFPVIDVPCDSAPNCCDPCDSTPSEGAVVPSALMDSCCANEDVTLIARVGNKMTRFTKSGFLQLVKGKATVVKTVDLMLSQLYHARHKIPGYGIPRIGEPLDSNYSVVADETGQMFAQRGSDDEDSLRMWDKDLVKYTTKPVSELPKTHKGLLPGEDELEIVGFAPIAADGNPATVREMHVLSGEGIIVFTKQATVASDCLCEGCQPVAAEASVARFLANPTGDGVYTLKFSVDDGHYWEEE